MNVVVFEVPLKLRFLPMKKLHLHIPVGISETENVQIFLFIFLRLYCANFKHHSL